jgi:hypothetical protein
MIALFILIGIQVVGIWLIVKTTPPHVRTFMDDWMKGEAMGQDWTNFYRQVESGTTEYELGSSAWKLEAELDASQNQTGVLVLRTDRDWKGDLLREVTS